MHSTYCIQHLKSTHSTSVCKMWQKRLDFVNQLLCRAWLSIKTPKLALRVSLTPNVRSLLIHYVINVCWISLPFHFDSVKPHQDATYLHTEPIVALKGFWIPTEDATLDNGCLYFVKGSHKLGLFKRYANL